jgi:hypothetical protein
MPSAGAQDTPLLGAAIFDGVTRMAAVDPLGEGRHPTTDD